MIRSSVDAAAGEQLAAIAKIMQALAAAPGDGQRLQKVLDAVTESAVRLCDADNASITRAEGGRLYQASIYGASHADEVAFVKYMETNPPPLDRTTLTGRVLLDRRSVRIADIYGEPGFVVRDVPGQDPEPNRSMLGVPLRRDDVILGVLVLRRKAVHPFTDAEEALAETFAAQATIAIENVRLFNETKEALEQQRAMSDVLAAIASASSDAQPVFDVIVRRSVALCAADRALLWRLDGNEGVVAALHGMQDTGFELGQRRAVADMLPARRVVAGTDVVHIPDMSADPEALSRPRRGRAYPTRLGVAIRGRDGRLFGWLNLTRATVRPFNDREIELVRGFASQAAVAIENVRLFNETKEALERQTAIAEILKVISSSPTDLQPVLDAIADSARQFCGAEDAFVGIADGDVVSVRAHVGPLGVPQGLFAIDRRTVTTRSMVDRTTIHVADLQRPEYASEYPIGHEQAKLTGQRATLATPLLREGKAIGAIMLRRSEPRPFTERQMELARTFADQAVIAIENVRLFNETNEALEQQTATADVLKVISRSAFDLDAVFESLLQKAVTICNADWGSIQRAEGDGVRNVAQVGGTQAFRELNQRTTYLPGRGTSNGRALLEKRPIHIPDLQADPEYTFKEALEAGGIRTNLVVPMVRDDKVIGTFGLSRNEVRPFTEKEIALVSTFADQAAIAIENVRLFNETKEALEQQTALAEILRVIAKSPTDVQPVLDAITRSAATFCAAEDATVGLLDGAMWSIRAHHGPVEINIEHWDTTAGNRVAQRPLRNDFVSGHAMIERRTVHVTDLQTAEARARYPTASLASPTARAIVATPLIRSGEPIGALFLRRREPIPFTERQIQLVETFADQAVIAIENVRLFNETKAALERQTATSEVLRSISGSAFEIGPVFEAILDQSLRLCDAEDAMVVRAEGGGIRVAAHRGPVDIDVARVYPMTRGLIAARAVIDGSTVHVSDMLAEPAEFPESYELATTYGFRSTLATPLRRQDGPVGAILIRRRDIRPFTPEQVRLLETFADQAVIAIENVRLFNETKEALERQTAVAGILRAISESPTDVQPVLDTIAESAARFCGAEDATLLMVDGDMLRTRAHHGPVPIRTQLALEFPLTRGTVTGRSILERQTVHVPDLTAESDDEYPIGKEQARRMGHRTTLATPLIREGIAIGAILLRRMEVRPFTEHQLELVRTFADQAVISIENVRLFNETKEALEQQAATARVLQVISRSAFDLRSALETLVEEAAHLCAADHGSIHRWDGSAYRTAAFWGPSLSDEYKREGFESPRYPGRDTLVGRTALEREVVHILDATTDPEYKVQSLQKLGGYRTMLGVPLMRDGFPIGVFALMRGEVHPFTERQIELVRTFADQAAIAIENVRLFNETKEALERQTATSEVLKVISHSAFDVQPVMDAVVETAGRLARADAAWMRRVSGGAYLPPGRGVGAHWAVTPELRTRYETALGQIATRVPGPGPRSVMGVVLRQRRTLHADDIAAREDLDKSMLANAMGARTVLAVPLMRQGEPLGFLVLAKMRVEPFSDREVQLVETFADQAAIAIENVRLFSEIQDKSRQLEVASRHKSEFLANMSHELRTPLNAIIGFTDVMLEEMFGPLNDKQKEYLEDVRNSGTHLLTLINDILDLSKIEAGRVELEMGEFSFPDALENALTLVRERATRHGISLAADVAGDVGRIDADERKVKQVLVNLLANAVKFTPDGGRVTVTARRANGEIEVAVHDTGIGVATEDQERIFDEFQQVGRDPERSREGTGLGLTLAKRFVELHGGRIWVESEVGRGSTFTFAIPLRQTALTGAKA